jgi:hypothetical protein
MKTTWFISGIIFLTGFFILAPLMKIMHWQGADYIFFFSAFAGFVFIPLSPYRIYTKRLSKDLCNL